MFGFSKKKEKEKEASQLERLGDAAGAESAPPKKPPVKLREGGGSVLKPTDQPSPAQPSSDATKQTPEEPRKKPKLRLMTGQEERERAFQAAREHFLSKSLPEIQKEVVRKERSKTFDVFLEKLFAVIGLFLVAVFIFWLYNNSTILDNWWQNFIDGIKLI